MSRRDVVAFFTAPARSGKSFRMVVRICDEILPHGEGMIYTNLPLYPERIAEYCEQKYGLDPDDVLRRLHIIPREVEQRWREAGKTIHDKVTGRKTGTHPLDGPWTYFEDKELAGATIIIDEIHNFCGSLGTPKPVSNQWQMWLGELGHNQAIFICISQAPEKVNACIKQEAQASYTIKNTGLDRDPYFRIEVYDWLDLWAGLFGRPYNVYVFEQEIKKNEGRRVRGQRKLTRMGPPYFDFYDSFAQPIAGEQTANLKAFEHEYERHLRKGPIRGRISLVLWFIFKNIQQLAMRGMMAAALIGVIVFMASGGAGVIMESLSAGLVKKNPPKEEKKAEITPPPPPSQANITASESLKTATREEADKIEKIRAVYEEELRKTLTEKEALSAESAKAVMELEILREEIERQSALVLITPDKIVFQGGYVYEAGEEIRQGKYKGRRIEAIDFRNREALLDDDSVLSLAR